MAKRENPLAKKARALFRYEPLTGKLYWRVDRISGRGKIQVKAGARAGAISGNGLYRQVWFDGKIVREHQLIWLMQTGDWPEALVDHQDTDGLNNKWRNLRAATHAQNSHNARLNSRNVAGLKGVRSHRSGKFQASITAHLGTFKSKHAAHAAYVKAAKLLHGAFANDGTRKGQSLGR